MPNFLSINCSIKQEILLCFSVELIQCLQCSPFHIWSALFMICAIITQIYGLTDVSNECFPVFTPWYVVSCRKVVLTTRLSFDDGGHCKGDEGGKFSLAEANNISVLPSYRRGRENIDCVIISQLQSRDHFLLI